MAAVEHDHSIAIHPVHAAILAGAPPLFLGGLLSDYAYFNSAQIQWSNFAAWLIAGAMVFTGLALLLSVIDLIRIRQRRGRPVLYVLVLVSLFILGLINSFVHARDAWAVMPLGLALSVVVTLLAFAATWLGMARWRGSHTA